MIDKHGFRLNAGIILANAENRLFWGRRVGKFDAWQFAQGGIHDDETPEQAMYRELHEELGLLPQHVQLLAVTKRWSLYYIPRHLRRRDGKKFTDLQAISAPVMLENPASHSKYELDSCLGSDRATLISEASIEIADRPPACVGQKQKWFLLRFIGDDSAISFTHRDSPEFLRWQWVDYWYPIKHVVTFKKKVYKSVLAEFEPILFNLNPGVEIVAKWSKVPK